MDPDPFCPEARGASATGTGHEAETDKHHRDNEREEAGVEERRRLHPPANLTSRSWIGIRIAVMVL